MRSNQDGLLSKDKNTKKIKVPLNCVVMGTYQHMFKLMHKGNQHEN